MSAQQTNRQQVFEQWARHAGAAQRRWMEPPTEAERIESIKRAYVAGNIDFTTFDLTLTAALSSSSSIP